jgi:hypothetical protein
VAIVALVGCESTVDAGKLQDKIKDGAKELGVKSVSCPSGQKMKSGVKFECTMELDDGQKVVYNVEVTDPKEGGVSWKANGLIVPIAAFIEDAKKQLELSSIDCPKKVIVVASGKEESITCKGSGGKEVSFTLDDKGKWKAKTSGGEAPAPAGEE